MKKDNEPDPTVLDLIIVLSVCWTFVLAFIVVWFIDSIFGLGLNFSLTTLLFLGITLSFISILGWCILRVCGMIIRFIK